MRFWSAPYELLPRAPISKLARAGARHGALLRIEFDDGALGYADVHPWTELGDAPLGEQLASIAHHRPTALTTASLRFARLDATARAARRSLWVGLQIPESHFLLPYGESASLPTEGFRRYKSKLPADPARAAALTHTLCAQLSPGMRLRLDFNSQLQPAAYGDFLNSLNAIARASIDFIEDPTPWVTGAGFGVPDTVPLAVDRASASAVSAGPCVAVAVVKPAVQDWTNLPVHGMRLVFTSYLDHPVGQLFAAYAAAQTPAAAHETHGLLSHLVYEPNDFSAALSRRGPRLIPAEGTGIGFDALLAALKWEALA